MVLAIGSTLGPYEIVEQIGAGGMGVVYRAHDARLQRDVAIKLLPLGVLSDEHALARFRREAIALAKLSHTSIATLHDVGDEKGLPYLVMEYVTGESIAQKLAAGPLAVREVVALGVEIASALEEAHEHGIVHRDLKPANVMVTPKGHAKVLDFGVAKLLTPATSPGVTAMSETVGAIGTLLYMSPEQAAGQAVDARSDIWSLGVLMYEALTGAPPFRGDSALTVLVAITEDAPAPLRAVRPDVPPELSSILGRALAKDPDARYAAAGELRKDLEALLLKLSGATPPLHLTPKGMHRGLMATSGLAILLLAGGSAWYYRRSEERHWASDRAPSEIRTLMDSGRALAAFLTLEKARGILPADSQLATLARTVSAPVTVSSSPAGATVEVQDYTAADDTWHPLGVTPLKSASAPSGYLRWRLTLPGGKPYVAAPLRRNIMGFALDSETTAPAGMVYAPGSAWADFISFIGWVGPYRLPPFYIDRYEVTNREYQRFVDDGGYAHREYWTVPFVEGERTLDWTEAMGRLRDSTGRPGPSTWRAGHFPEGRADYPVSGVSWYEAAAFSAWANKSLPVLAQWYYAAPPNVGALTVRASNISREHLAPVGSFKGVGPFGTYDMAGNVREWVANPLADSRRLILGGAWPSESYLYSEPEALSPFDRSATNGFRCVRNLSAVPKEAFATITPLERDFSTVKPASDEVFRAYQVMYSYDKMPLDAKLESVHDQPDWREERVTFRTVYADARMAAYLFLPKHVKPPFQTIVFFPSARVLDLTDSRQLGDVDFFDFVVESGRAVMYPIYQDTYERRVRTVLPGASQEMALTVQRFKDLARSLDYLGTRSDIDTTRLAYLGVSMGSAEGVIYTTLLQDRLRTDVFLDGGFFLDKPSAGRDQADFAPRLKIPVLMVNGRYDFSFSLQRAQLPLFQMLGTRKADKKHVVLESPHDVRAKRPELIAAVLPWLDKYLGPVR